MATISPAELACGSEPFTSTAAYLKLTITSITDGTAEANTRTIGWKVTIHGTANNWTTLHARYVSLGSTEIVPFSNTKVSSWTNNTIINSGTTSYTNDSAGNLTLYAYIRQLFYYNYSAERWNDPTKYQDAGVNMVCSQLPRYATFTSHTASSELNKITISWTADSTCDMCEYTLNNGSSWTTVSGSPYTITGLTPNTTYSIKTRIRRTDSQLKTTSSALSVTTKATPTVSSTGNFNLNATPNPSISISSLDYITKWYAEIKDGSTQILSTGDITTQSKELVLNTSSIVTGMLNRHSNTKRWTLTVVPHCVSNGTTYNLDNITFDCIMRDTDYLPTFTASNVSYVVTDSQTNDVTGSTAKVIKGISDVRVTCTAASPATGTTIKAYSATSGTASGATTDTSTRQINLTNVTGDSVTVQATDNREQSTTVVKPYSTFIDYFAPTVVTKSATRESGVGKNVIVSITGTYCYWTGLSQSNGITQVSIEYKLKSASSYTTISGVNLTITNGTDGTFTVSGTITGNKFEVANEYKLKITLQDKFNTVLLDDFDIPTGNALIWRDLTNKRVGIKKKPSYNFDVSGNGNIQTLYVNGTKTIWYS